MPLGIDLKKQTNTAEKHHQKLDKVFESNENEEYKFKVLTTQI